VRERERERERERNRERLLLLIVDLKKTSRLELVFLLFSEIEVISFSHIEIILLWKEVSIKKYI
jgi:hypothetical protein